MSTKYIFACFLMTASLLATGQTAKYPPRDESEKDAELHAFVNALREIIKDKDAAKLLAVLHPEIKIDFDDGIGIEQFKKNWEPENDHSSLWPIMNRIVNLGGVFNNNPAETFYAFVFPYVNAVELDEADDYFTTLVITSAEVNVREKPDANSKVLGQLTYDIVTYDYEKSTDQWYFVKTKDNKITGYIKSDFAYCPVDYRMFLTKEKGKWMISCIIAGD